MSFVVSLTKKFNSIQGLTSPVRKDNNLPKLQPADGSESMLEVGINFEDSQLNDRGWFVDSDKIDVRLDGLAEKLSSKKWTELFEFRPTYELVAKWIFEEISKKEEQLSYVKLSNETLNIAVKYSKERGSDAS